MLAKMGLRIALVAPLVSAIREPMIGGVAVFLTDLAEGLQASGHSVDLFAASGSMIDGLNIVDTGVDPSVLSGTAFRPVADSGAQEVTAEPEGADSGAQEVTAEPEGADRRAQEVTAEPEGADRRGQEVTANPAGADRRGQEVTANPAGGSRREDPITAVAFRAAYNIVAEGGYDLVHNHSFDAAAISLAGLPDVPVLHTLHLPPDAAVAAALRAAGAGRRPPHVAVVSQSQRSLWARKARVDVVLSPGVPTSRIEWSGLSPGAMLFAGRLSPEKGAIEAIRIAEICGRDLMIAGSPYDLEYSA
ncbi:MAG: glycosyltransferase, partial [Actinomycetota bacterium]